MHTIDAILTPLIPTLILIHLLIAPYTKVEESFNIQAVHDISTYGFTAHSPSASRDFDHFAFPGAVPRTFVGALALAGISKPAILWAGRQSSQFIVRVVLGLFNAFALLRFKNGLASAYGRDVGRWYILLQATQFHVIYYASRTLPNMFAFGLTTMALREFLPPARGEDGVKVQRRQKLGIFLLVFSGVVFRSEIAVLLATQLLYMLVIPRISLETVIPAGIGSAIISLAISVPIDSYFWQKPIWPELAGFYFNAIQGNAVEWGTSPLHYYFTSLLPKLLLNPLIMFVLIPLALNIPTFENRSAELVVPSIIFIAIYSLQPHKEARFIIYAVPPLTAAASLSASYIWTRRSKTLFYRLGSLAIAASVAGSFVASTGMLFISSLNYPGGDAISQVNAMIQSTKHNEPSANPMWVRVHMDVLSCMTGVTRFQEIHWDPIIDGRQAHIENDKTENQTALHDPEFWAGFDYALMEKPELAIGKWEVVGTAFGYAGIERLRPGDVDPFAEQMEKIYLQNNIPAEAVPGENEGDTQKKENLKMKLLLSEMDRFAMLSMIKGAVRSVTGGHWVGPRVEPKIRILRRLPDESVPKMGVDEMHRLVD